MKYSCFLLVLVLFSNCETDKGTTSDSLDANVIRIDSLLEAKSYFEAQRWFLVKKDGLPQFDSIRLAAHLQYYFNELEISNVLINRLLTDFKPKMTDSLQSELLALQYVNQAKLQHYATAYDLGKRLLRDYPKFLDEDEEKDYRNANAIWKNLQDVPPQALTRKGATEIQMVRDKANLTNLPVAVNGKHMDFIFDTGANLSTTVESTAKELGMRRIPASIQVGSITGRQVTASLAVCPLLHIGNMAFEHVIFLVFPDEALYIPQLDYQIRGVLGFPVIEAMKQVTLTRDDRFLVPLEPEPRKEANMALNFLVPILELEHSDGSRYPYAFDTGAVNTLLYPKYFKTYQQQIESEYEPEAVEFGGAGGSITKTGYRVTFTPKINDKIIELDSIELIATDTTETFQHFYGNLGQDLIGQFKAITLNFESMYLAFE